MHGAEVRVLEDADHVGLARLLQSGDRGGLEAKVALEVLTSYEWNEDKQAATGTLGCSK